ncbi:deazaflavin-dependent oxidoreductase (nitroreductase family) [Allocatelliglobosispora scoriae]|uniref:Deazaflavin-dependent oxidoreductase (Nitroreductase family) n=1 Tax=Allocatelliglobosispora scoriae TaxID=643052 RepID=A0A841BNP3_9ACTN|nr:nitroreductase family deazaflavin-dependent oxidoreductase [Allocatelliglobosispora scoriae]MBB5868441.1 deazaflavin-dependent oxidoreductase (nitroreductase family) [Allocatelliglobosispora scoriae]
MLYGEEHVRRYIETDGQEGHEWRPGVPALLLTTTGRKSGKHYVTPLIYQSDGDATLVVASKGGADAPPEWFRNLQANPDVEVQIWGEKFPARARVATPEEKPAMWQKMASVWPAYDDYQKKTDREIPVVVLDRV